MPGDTKPKDNNIVSGAPIIFVAATKSGKLVQAPLMKAQTKALVLNSITYTPDMTNVITLRLVYTNSAVFTNMNRTNATLVWKTNKVSTGEYIVSYPTNAWEYALVWNSNAAPPWRPVGIASNLPPRTTNGQWFEHLLPLRASEQRYFQLAKVYSIGIMWNYTYAAGSDISFRTYTGTASRSYTSMTNLTWAATYIGTETQGNYIGDALFTTWIHGLPSWTDVYLAMTAVDTDGLESDFSIELVIPAQNR